MDTKDKINENINVMKEQIDKFDNKANLLIAIVGIVFAISLGMIDVFNQLAMADPTQEDMLRRKLLLIFTILYFITFTLEMIFLLLVIYPRKKRHNGKKSLSYYIDVSKMSIGDIRSKLESEDTDSEVDQLIINATICTQKHTYLVKAIWTLVPLFLFVVAMFFTAIL